MKALLLKDFYMIRKYCKIYLFIFFIFLGAVAFLDEYNLFMLLYPALFAGMIPANLMAYDEKSEWTVYEHVFPYTKGKIVSEKYVLCILLTMMLVVLSVVAFGINGILHGRMEAKEIVDACVMIPGIAFLPPTFMLPLIYKMGAEKGRIFYVAGVMIIMMLLAQSSETGLMEWMQGFPLMEHIQCLFIVGAGILFILSWMLSIWICRRREHV